LPRPTAVPTGNRESSGCVTSPSHRGPSARAAMPGKPRAEGGALGAPSPGAPASARRAAPATGPAWA